MIKCRCIQKITMQGEVFLYCEIDVRYKQTGGSGCAKRACGYPARAARELIFEEDCHTAVHFIIRDLISHLFLRKYRFLCLRVIQSNCI